MLDPCRDTPSAVVKSITEHGGVNQYGKPYWRVVLSHNHTRPKKGIWHEFPDGKMEQFTPNGTGGFTHNPLHAIRVVEEIRDTQVWPKNGWILERWFPAEVWGSRETWNSGPYPEQGEYYLIAPGPDVTWEELPETNDLKQAISMWERDYLSRPRDFDVAYAMFVAEEQAAEEAARQKQAEEMEYFYRHEVASIFNSTSLSAQAIRNQCADAAGVREHIGAGQ